MECPPTSQDWCEAYKPLVAGYEMADLTNAIADFCESIPLVDSQPS